MDYVFMSPEEHRKMIEDKAKEPKIKFVPSSKSVHIRVEARVVPRRIIKSEKF